MCGLLFLKGYNPQTVGKKTAKRYHRQKARGSEGFGFVAIDNATGNVVSYERYQDEAKMLLDLGQAGGGTIMFHHRLPTSTLNIAECAHPIKVSHQTLPFDFYLIHNGIIHNADELKEEHNALGFKYQTETIEQLTVTTQDGRYYNVDDPVIKFNDSEALAVDLALVLAGAKLELEARGPIAFVGLVTSKRGKVKEIVFGRNGFNPLKKEVLPDGRMVLSSEGRGEDVLVNTLHRLDWKTNALTTSPMIFPTTYTLGYQLPVSYTDKNGLKSDFTDIPRLPMGKIGQNDFGLKSDIAAEISQLNKEIDYIEAEMSAYEELNQTYDPTYRTLQIKHAGLVDELENLYSLEYERDEKLY